MREAHGLWSRFGVASVGEIGMQRRELLKLGALLAAGRVAGAAPAAGKSVPIPVIDTHIHLFDPSRPGGVPWPLQTDTALYKAALPDRYTSLAGPLGVVGAIVIEASPLASDNDWVLNVAARYPIILGMIGDLVPGTDSFPKELERLQANSLFLGMRYGNLWGRDLAIEGQKPEFLAGLKMLAERGLVLDSANPDLNLIRAIAGVANRIPELRMVVDHLPTMRVSTEPAKRDEYWSLLRQLAQNKNIYVKLSEVLAARSEQGGGPSFNHDTLEALWGIFGEDHVLYASDWPNSDHHATYAETISVVREFAGTRGRRAEEKFFWKNSVAAYRWHKRAPNQP